VIQSAYQASISPSFPRPKAQSTGGFRQIRPATGMIKPPKFVTLGQTIREVIHENDATALLKQTLKKIERLGANQEFNHRKTTLKTPLTQKSYI
jgi:hypothetical protein